MEYRISVAEAAELMGVSQQFIRVGLQKKELPFGTAVQITRKKYTYFISRSQFNEYLGIRDLKREETYAQDSIHA